MFIIILTMQAELPMETRVLSPSIRRYGVPRKCPIQHRSRSTIAANPMMAG